MKGLNRISVSQMVCGVGTPLTIYEAQQLLGHYNISMTERYAHLFSNTLQERLDIIADSLDFDLI